MEVDIEIKNYRCFSDESPARIKLKDSFISFVGVNNSGKSTLLRFFYEYRFLFVSMAHLGNSAKWIPGPGAFRLTQSNSIRDRSEVFTNTNNRDLSLSFEFQAINTFNSEKPENVSVRVNVKQFRNSRQNEIVFDEIQFNGKPLGGNRGVKDFLVMADGINVDLTPFIEFCQDISKSIYIGPHRNGLQVSSEKAYYDIQVGRDFVSTWRDLKVGNKNLDNERIYKLTNDIATIFNFEGLEINPTNNDENLQVFVNGKSYLIQELGAGLAQFILVLGNTAFKEPGYILIDEPESNLHPSLQLDFLTTLGSYSRRGVLFATHSIGLARAASDRVYSLRKNEFGNSVVSDLESISRLPEFLGELSFSGYREMGFDFVLMVEGRTDVKTFQQFLRHLKKDHKVVILPLGGNDMIGSKSTAELNELTRISEKIFAIVDSEKSNQTETISKERRRFKQLCARSGIKCHVLERRATENYFSEAAIKKVMGSGYRALAPFEKLEDLPLGWGKQDNWRIAREMNLADLKDTDLGNFLRQF